MVLYKLLMIGVVSFGFATLITFIYDAYLRAARDRRCCHRQIAANANTGAGARFLAPKAMTLARGERGAARPPTLGIER